MAGSTFLPTSDIRHHRTQSKREHDHKAKWARGERPLNGHRWEEKRRPEGYMAKSKHERKAHAHLIKRLSYPAKNANSGLRSVFDEGMKEASDLSDSYSDDVPESYIDGVPDLKYLAEQIEVFYSFDLPTAPRAGEHLLSAALNKAVERFETKETEKLVMEYEFVDEHESVCADGYIADEDDYEFVDREFL